MADDIEFENLTPEEILKYYEDILELPVIIAANCNGSGVVPQGTK